MKKEKVDCLLLHVPKNLSPEVGYIALLTMGLFALADILHRNGYSSRILHLGVERIKNSSFAIEEYLAGREVLAVGLSLHWHYQSYDSLQIASRIKAVRPDIKIILGGYTASFFAGEILEHFKSVDYVIQGDGEIPLLRLMGARSEKDLSAIPNLLWRQKGRVRRNEVSYVASREDLDALRFTRFDLMENFSLYRKMALSNTIHFYREETLPGYGVFPVFVGRGCAVNCAFCGAGRLSQKRVSTRARIAARSPEKVLESIAESVRAGFEEVFICFDPWRRRSYFTELFRLIRRAGIETRMRFGCWSLPSRHFMDDFRRTFRDGSSMEISAETGSDRLRRLIKGYSFTNRQLVSTLRYLEKIGIGADVFFGYPLPFCLPDDLEATDRLIDRLKSEFRDVHRVFMGRMSFDPASPMFLSPGKYGIRRKVKSFLDYYRPLQGPEYLPEGMELAEYRRRFAKYDRAQEGLWLLAEAQAYLDLKAYEKAIEAATRAAERTPGEVETHLALGRGLEEMKRTEEARDVYVKALKLFPGHGALYFGLARSQVMLGDHERAAENARRALKSNHGEGNVHLLLGLCYEKLGHDQKAAKEWRKAKELSPDSAAIHLSLSRCYRRMNQVERAGQEMEEGLLKFMTSRKHRPEALGIQGTEP
jgi:radical SAM superfamily enzyme YgiQ (UPF0313 family)/cytochrome c-type biogenesis protein CcmH/NrfG